MALPREPRQKMINIMYLVLTAILALNVSNEVINAFRTVNISLENSNGNITNSNEGLYKNLEAKLANQESHEKAAIWEPKALLAKNYSKTLSDYIEGLKQDLKKEADLKMSWDNVKKDSVEDYRMDNLDASTRLFENKKKGEELEKKLKQYKQDMLGIDPAIRKEFENTLPIDVTPPESIDGTKKDFTQTYFHMTPTIAALTMLSKFQNNVKNAESQVVTYCNAQINAVVLTFDRFKPLVSQTSNYLMPGQQLTVRAGVGAFSSASTPTVTIGGQTVSATEGYGEKVFTASGSGDQTIPIHISFKDQNGKVQTVDDKVEYTVGKPGGAAVMLDKMNVFYIGVPNPVSISSGTGWDKTHVSMAGGTLTPAGGPGKFTVNVSTVGKASITVNADSKPSTYDFRVKRIPDPVFMVGPSKGGRMQSVVFKNQQFCRADLENFDFDARFTVISATVYFAGANFSNVQTASISGGSLAPISAQMAKCIPGTSITFDNVKVQGPDGTVRVIQGPGFILY